MLSLAVGARLLRVRGPARRRATVAEAPPQHKQVKQDEYVEEQLLHLAGPAEQVGAQAERFAERRAAQRLARTRSAR